MKKKADFPYVERDVSWMYFNRRVLQEACKEDVPLLERLSFLGIYSNNFDEFFRVRVASQNRIIEWAGKQNLKEVRTAKMTVRQISKLNSKYLKDYETAIADVYAALRRENVCLISDSEVTEEQMEFIRDYYSDRLDGLIVPIWFSAVKHLDYESDQSIYLAVRAVRDDITDRTAYDYSYFELPVQSCGRFIRLPDKDGKSYIMYLDDVVRCSLPRIFAGSGCSGFESYAFKFTRDAEMEIDDDQRNGILQKVSKGLKTRKKGEPLRVVYDGNMPPDLLRRVMSKLDLGRNDTVVDGGRYQNHKDLMKFPHCGRKDLEYPPMPPVRIHSESIIRDILQQDRFIHVPYHDFSYFLGLLHEAAVDRNVKSIKITLYRLAKDSKVIRALVGAARNGKKVTAVVELLARFDEESNMVWAQKLRDAGVKVIFGVEGLKVHSKVVHIGMKKGPDISCVSTGNFHEGNARSYTDCIMMTASRRISDDVNLLFEFIEKPYIPVKFKGGRTCGPSRPGQLLFGYGKPPGNLPPESLRHHRQIPRTFAHFHFHCRRYGKNLHGFGGLDAEKPRQQDRSDSPRVRPYIENRDETYRGVWPEGCEAGPHSGRERRKQTVEMRKSAAVRFPTGIVRTL